MSNDTFFSSRLMAPDTQQATQIYNELIYRMTAGFGRIKSRTPTAPPAAIVGDAYLVPVGGTGDWVGLDGNVVIYVNGWLPMPPQTGMRFYIEDESMSVEVRGSGVITALDGVTALPVVLDGSYQATWDCALGTTATLLVTQAMTILMAPLNMVAGRTYELFITQDGGGGHAMAYEAGEWASVGALDMTLQGTGGASTLYVFRGPHGSNKPREVTRVLNIQLVT